MKNLKDKTLFREAGLIGGEWVAAGSGKTVDVVDPATQATIGTVPDMTGPETRAAQEAPTSADPTWRQKTNPEPPPTFGPGAPLAGPAAPGRQRARHFRLSQLETENQRRARCPAGGLARLDAR